MNPAHILLKIAKNDTKLISQNKPKFVEFVEFEISRSLMLCNFFWFRLTSEIFGYSIIIIADIMKTNNK